MQKKTCLRTGRDKERNKREERGGWYGKYQKRVLETYKYKPDCLAQ